MAAEIHVGEPGTIRAIHYYGKRGADGKSPVTLWGTVEEQVKEAQATNREYMWSGTHKMIDLYAMECEHVHPEEDEQFDDVEELLAAWMARNCAGLTWGDGDLYYKNRERGQASIPKYVAYMAADDEYSENHNSVCLLAPMGSCCAVCSDGDDDGHEEGACRMPDQLKDDEGTFWWANSPEGIAYMSKQSAT